MPDFCAAYRCANRRCLEARTRGITFHQFPKNGERRKKWEVALRRDGFAASNRSLLCSEHFRSEDFDRTGQTVRVKDGVVPTIFNFPAHLQRSEATRSTATSRRAEDKLPNPMDLMPDVGASEESRLRLKGQRKQQATDHSYALPASPKAIKAKLAEASARVRILQREKSNALRREKRAKNNMQALLEELKEKNLINEELKDKLDCYSDLPVHLLSRQGVEYTKAQRDFALALHLHGPKAYHYLRETLHIHLPHPSSLQRWLSSLDARPGLNKMMLDMLERRRQEDEDKYGCVSQIQQFKEAMGTGSETGFVVTERSLLCSEHFKPDDFDRTGQIVRLRHGQVPSRTTKASRKAEETLPVDLPQHFPEAETHSNVDHNYALPASPTVLKARLSEALARVESLEREKRNSMLRERRAKKNVCTLLEDLREKNLINEELKDRLDFYSDLRVDLLAKKRLEYTRESGTGDGQESRIRGTQGPG
ncbi:THAP domain-containing protein 6 [Merluccius polli]|uniref:THAP domain-containing protein 6 n=1 Tax=Merluccius polli TaxID=89951 RepID=A0AA47M2P5_MERPO|nr:THAP domain-containing protein 6 [Merluccius polli]